jgi:hypothetical protein
LNDTFEAEYDERIDLGDNHIDMILMKVLLADGFMDADKNDKLTVRMRVGAYCTNKDTEVLEIPHSKLKNYASMLRGKTFGQEWSVRERPPRSSKNRRSLRRPLRLVHEEESESRVIEKVPGLQLENSP